MLLEIGELLALDAIILLCHINGIPALPLCPLLSQSDNLIPDLELLIDPANDPFTIALPPLHVGRDPMLDRLLIPGIRAAIADFDDSND